MSRGQLARLEQAFWDFSCDLYAKPEVKQGCLLLQDQHDLSVNLLLFCLWQGRAQHQLLKPGFFQHDIAAFEQLDREVLAPFRAKRRASRQQQDAPWLYDMLLKMELDLEHRAQAALVAAAQRSQQLQRDGSGKAELLNLGSYLKYRGVAPDEVLLTQLKELINCLE